MRLKPIFVLLFLGAPFVLLHAQNASIQRIDIGVTVIGTAITQTTDGGYVAGASFDPEFNNQSPQFPCIIKCDGQGNAKWARSIGNGMTGHIFSVAASANGSFFAAGTIDHTTGGRMFVMKCDNTGNTLWTKSLLNDIDTVHCTMAATGDGGCIVAGNLAAGGVPSEEIYVMKLNTGGAVDWIRHLTSDSVGNTTTINSIISLDNSGYILTGYSLGSPSFGFGLVVDLCLFKLSASGSLDWSRAVDGSILFGLSAVKTRDGGFVVCGEALDNATFASNVYAAKFDSNGSIRWGKQINLFSNEIGTSIAEAPGGDLVICGSYNSDSTGFSDSVLVVRASSEGEIKSAKLFAIPGLNSSALAITSSSDGGFAFTGWLQDLPLHPFYFLLTKLDANGNGCYLQNELFSSRPDDSVIDVYFSESHDLIADTLDLQTGANLDITQVEICAIASVETSRSAAEGVSLFPNPLTGRSPLTISLDGSVPEGIYDLTLCDLSGNTIKKGKVTLSGTKQDILFDVSECTAGVYIIEIRSEKEPKFLQRMKLIKE